MGGIINFAERWKRLKEIDDGKHELIESLLGEVKRLREKLDDTELQLEREKDTSKMYHHRYRENDVELKNTQKVMDSNAFVSVLIDGDCMNFLDHFVISAESGGQEAAQLLQSGALDYLRHEIPELSHDLDVVIRVYGNLNGLNKIYCDANILDQREEFASFMRGFNMAHPLCDFVDAGNGKECSDVKIREITKLHVGDLHCKHIIFGGSADNGYARMLGPYVGNDSMSKRITMLEGPPFALELSKLKQKFRTTSFPSVFRDTKLSPRSGSFPNNVSNGTSLKPSSWAATLVSRPTLQQQTPKLEIAPSVEEYDNHDPIPRNSKGQRIDPPLLEANQKFIAPLIASVKSRKYCNNYHLLGDCPHYGCIHEHGEKLNGMNLNTLRYIARATPCKAGFGCDDADCYWGHQCARDNCKMDEWCRYPLQKHSVDTRIVNQ